MNLLICGLGIKTILLARVLGAFTVVVAASWGVGIFSRFLRSYSEMKETGPSQAGKLANLTHLTMRSKPVNGRYGK